MNLFRSEEHVKNWVGYRPGSEEGILDLQDVVSWFSGDFFRRRLDEDYVSRSKEYVGGFLAALTELGKKRPFWNPAG